MQSCVRARLLNINCHYLSPPFPPHRSRSPSTLLFPRSILTYRCLLLFRARKKTNQEDFFPLFFWLAPLNCMSQRYAVNINARAAGITAKSREKPHWHLKRSKLARRIRKVARFIRFTLHLPLQGFTLSHFFDSCGTPMQGLMRRPRRRAAAARPFWKRQ